MSAKTFLSATSWILVASAAGKFVSLIAASHPSSAHPLLPSISHGEFLFLSAACELGILGVLWANFIPEIRKIWLVYWVATIFAIYHFWAEFLLKIRHCGCFGLFKNHLVNHALDWLAYASVAFLLFGSLVVLIRSHSPPSHEALTS